jgi:uncharacterized protein (TIGR03435 family)
MKRAIFSGILNFGIFCSFAVAANAQSPNQSNHAPRRAPKQAISFDVQIAPTTMAENTSSIDMGADSWKVRGFSLRDLIAQVYDIDPRRVDLPVSEASEARYDVSLTLRPDDSDEDVQQRLRDAIEDKFNLNVAPVSRTMDVYVITAPGGAGPALHLHRAGAQSAVRTVSSEDSNPEGPGRITYEEQVCPGVSSGKISASMTSLPEFRRTLEPNMDRLLVDETHLNGSYDFKIAEYHSREDLFQIMRNQLGLVVTPARRNVTILSVRPAQPTIPQPSTLEIGTLQQLTPHP